MSDRFYTGILRLVEIGIPPKIRNHLVLGQTNVTMMSAFRSTDLAINHDTVTTLSGLSELFDIGSNLNATTGIYTAPVTGYYQTNGGVLFYDASTKLGLVACYIHVDGSMRTAGSYWMGTDHAYAGSSVNSLIYLTAGQEMLLAGLMQTNDTGAGVFVGGYCHFSTYLVARA